MVRKYIWVLENRQFQSNGRIGGLLIRSVEEYTARTGGNYEVRGDVNPGIRLVVENSVSGVRGEEDEEAKDIFNLESSSSWIPRAKKIVEAVPCVPKNSPHVANHIDEPPLLKEFGVSRETIVEESLLGELEDRRIKPFPLFYRRLRKSNQAHVVSSFRSTDEEEEAENQGDFVGLEEIRFLTATNNSEELMTEEGRVKSLGSYEGQALSPFVLNLPPLASLKPTG
ncbi:hypothetical protein L484_010417 [Morus notabilis]|uniref:Uncharacterized protein n=1 Tax=Morus notabilis TaxID=981085 RepID=W9QYX7_9ROSA|nr:hypothetical protein L484_010417 [Morus notabilis]